MKTLDEVIKGMEHCHEDMCMECPYQFEPKDFDCITQCQYTDALHYLKEYRTLQCGYVKAMADLEDNPPLTWDELKTMKGKPVWMERKNSELYHMWGLVARIKRYQGHEYAVIKCSDLCNSPMKDIRIYDIMFPNDDWQVYRKERK